ncbi:MAG: class I SAM-dependent methyltransferase [Candidatus Diapherotrites archaeon]
MAGKSSIIYQSREFAAAWDKYLGAHEDILRTRMMNLILLEEIGNLKGKNVLDAGCGNGFFIKYLSKLKPKKIFAFDISQQLIKIARKRYDFVDFRGADLIKKTPYKEGQFDCVICYNVFMDLPRIETATRELSRVTKKGGKIHIVIVHPLYNLFFNDIKAKTESITRRLRRYTSEERILVGTIPGFGKFTVYRRPLSRYLNEFKENHLFLEKMIEVPISEEVAKIDKKYKERTGVPVFAYFKLKKE